jgi:hypothetical protein
MLVFKVPGNNILLGVFFEFHLPNIGINVSNITFLGIHFVTGKQTPP